MTRILPPNCLACLHLGLGYVEKGHYTKARHFPISYSRSLARACLSAANSGWLKIGQSSGWHLPFASSIAKARHVRLPHSRQFVLGRNLWSTSPAVSLDLPGCRISCCGWLSFD